MAETSVVNADWEGVSLLSGLLDGQARPPLLQAVFVAPWGDWRLAAVISHLDSTGTLPIYEALDEAARREGVALESLSRLLLLDLYDPEAQRLFHADVEPLPPRRFDLTLTALPEHVGAVIKRNRAALRVFSQRRLEVEVLMALKETPYEVHLGIELEGGWRADAAVLVDRGSIPIEIAVADRKNYRSRLASAAGIANLVGLPLVLVFGLLEPDESSSLKRHGTVPVFEVKWGSDGAPALHRAVEEAAAWLSHRST